ncbi:hypothetical protein T484DRAFT_1930426 [Baffinella frigidus]|nr:hypothetical protein T484DRAFT_1930426 [Cryptophyta sp. CCMP2293]
MPRIAVLFACLGAAHAFLSNAMPPSSTSVRARISPASPLALRMSSETTLGRREAMGAGLAALSFVAFPREGVADRSYTSMTTATRKYIPKIKEVIAFYENDLKAMIEAGEWEAVTAAVTAGGKAYKLAYVETYKSGVVNEVKDLKGPFKVLVSSITASDSETSATLRCYAYLAKYSEFNTKLAAAAGAQDMDAALKAWAAGALALRLTVDNLNPGIPRSVGKVELAEMPAEVAAVKATLDSATSAAALVVPSAAAAPAAAVPAE